MPQVRPKFLKYNIDPNDVNRAANSQYSGSDIIGSSLQAVSEVLKTKVLTDDERSLYQAQSQWEDIESEISNSMEDPSVFSDPDKLNAMENTFKQKVDEFNKNTSGLPMRSSTMSKLQDKVNKATNNINLRIGSGKLHQQYKNDTSMITTGLAKKNAGIEMELEKGTPEGRSNADKLIQSQTQDYDLAIKMGMVTEAKAIQDRSSDIAKQAINAEMTTKLNDLQNDPSLANDPGAKIIELDKFLNSFTDNKVATMADSYSDGIKYVDRDILMNDILNARDNLSATGESVRAKAQKSYKALLKEERVQQEDKNKDYNNWEKKRRKLKSDIEYYFNDGEYKTAAMLSSDSAAIAQSYDNYTDVIRDKDLMNDMGIDSDEAFNRDSAYSINIFSKHGLDDVKEYAKSNPYDAAGAAQMILESSRNRMESDDLIPALKDASIKTGVNYNLLLAAYDGDDESFAKLSTQINTVKKADDMSTKRVKSIPSLFNEKGRLDEDKLHNNQINKGIAYSAAELADANKHLISGRLIKEGIDARIKRQGATNFNLSVNESIDEKGYANPISIWTNQRIANKPMGVAEKLTVGEDEFRAELESAGVELNPEQFADMFVRYQARTQSDSYQQELSNILLSNFEGVTKSVTIDDLDDSMINTAKKVMLSKVVGSGSFASNNLQRANTTQSPLVNSANKKMLAERDELDRKWNVIESQKRVNRDPNTPYKANSNDFNINVLSHRLNSNIRFGTEVNDNMLKAIFQVESSHNHKSVNPQSGATGLIQFMPNTAKRLGTTTEALANMDYAEQMPYIEKYFKGVGAGNLRNIKSVEDLYLAVLNPSGIRLKPGDAMWKSGSNEYKQNSGLDLNGDGVITKQEATMRVRKIYDNLNGGSNG